MEPKPDLRAEQKAERRRRILAAARQIIAKRGYEALTMRDLAAASRVTVPTIYNLVGSKDEVLSSAVAEQTVGFLEAVASAERTTPAAGVLSVSAASTEQLLQMPEYYQTLLRLLLSGSRASGVRRNVNAQLEESFLAALDDMRSAGDLADWVDCSALAQRLAAHQRMAAIDWAAGNLDGDELRRTTTLGTCLMLLGVATGASRRELEARAKAVPGAAPHRPRARKAARPARS